MQHKEDVPHSSNAAVPESFEEMKALVPSLGMGDVKDNRNIYNIVMAFFRDPNQTEMVFADAKGNPTLSTGRRKLVHEIVVPLGLAHFSEGKGNKRVLHLLKNPRPLAQGRWNKETEAWELVPDEMKGQKWKTNESKLVVVTFNVLMDQGESAEQQYNLHELIFTKQRWPAIYDILGKTEAHFIALQEVTREFQEGLLKQNWVRERYYVSDIKEDNFSFMGNLILSVFPFDRILLRNYTQEFGEPKVTVEGYIDSLNGRRLSIFNVHLKAGTKCEREREKEIHENIAVQLGDPNVEDALYLGDFNMRDVVNERNLRLEENYVDLWKEFHGLKTDQPMPEGHKGYTYDLEVNTTAKCVSDIVSAIKKTQGYNSRFDRIHLRSNDKEEIKGEDKRKAHNAHMGRWTVQDMWLSGTEPIYITSNGDKVFPSDHFGIVVHLQLLD